MQEYEPEAVEAFRKLYSEKKDTIDYLEKFGNKFEKAQAMLIKEIATMSDDKNARRSFADQCGHLSSSSSPYDGEE